MAPANGFGGRTFGLRRGLTVDAEVRGRAELGEFAAGSSQARGGTG